MIQISTRREFRFASVEIRIEDAPLILRELALVSADVPDDVNASVLADGDVRPAIHVWRMNGARFGIDPDRSGEGFACVSGFDVPDIVAGDIRDMDSTVRTDLGIGNLAVTRSRENLDAL